MPSLGARRASIAIVGSHSKGGAKEGATRPVNEVDALETAQDNPHSSVGTLTVHVLPSDSSLEEEEGVDLVKKKKLSGFILEVWPFLSSEEKEKVG